MKVVVDRSVCIGAASCVALAAKTFQLDAEGKAEGIFMEEKIQTREESSGKVTSANDPRGLILDAAKSCPVQAISVFDDEGSRLV